MNARYLRSWPENSGGPAPATRWQVCLATLLLLTSLAPRATAQEPSGLQAALALEKTLVDTIAGAEKSVVAIARVRKDARLEGGPDPTSPDFVPNEFGTGVVIDRLGLILTNYHVLGEIEKNDYYVWVDRRPYPAKASVEAADPWMDLAVLKIDADNLQPIDLGDAKSIKKGQIVIALGNPYAIARDGQVSASWGIVANTSRKAALHGQAYQETRGRETLHHYGTLIQVDMKLNLGSSGGALLNLKGEMIGLTTSLAALAGYDKAGGFAIPVNEAFLRTLEKLKSAHKADYGFLGVDPGHLTAAQRRRGEFGSLIRGVAPGTPAEKASLQAGDIVTHVDGERVDDANALIRLLSQLPAESQAALTILRGGAQEIVTVTLSKRHMASSRKPYSRIEQDSWRGMRVDYATAIPMFQQLSHLVDPDGCVAVLEVERDSPAWKAGIRGRSFISHVGRARVATPGEFYEAVAGLGGVVYLRATAAQGNENSVRAIEP